MQKPKYLSLFTHTKRKLISGLIMQGSTQCAGTRTSRCPAAPGEPQEGSDLFTRFALPRQTELPVAPKQHLPCSLSGSCCSFCCGSCSCSDSATRSGTRGCAAGSTDRALLLPRDDSSRREAPSRVGTRSRGCTDLGDNRFLAGTRGHPAPALQKLSGHPLLTGPVPPNPRRRSSCRN